MKTIKCLIFFLFIPLGIFAHGSGFGYILDLGGGTPIHRNGYYNQDMSTYIHNAFIRIHSDDGHRATQFQVGFRKDEVNFQNYSEFLGPDNSTLMSYNSNGSIQRSAWRFGVLQQYQFGMNPGRFCFALNAGMFYEGSLSARRESVIDGINYNLYDEINPHNLGWTLGAEMRIRKFTFGYRMEKLFWDILDHDYILSQTLNLENSSELRGIKMNPLMHFFYIGFSIDYY